MSLRIGDEAPNFTADTTEGEINFHEYLGDTWAFYFRIRRISHLSAQLNWAKPHGSNPNLISET